MALVKQFEDRAGVTHDNAYWRIVGIAFDLANNVNRIAVVIYHDEATRRAGKQPVSEANMVFPAAKKEGDSTPLMVDALAALDGGKGLRPYLYDRLKAQPILAGAVDA